MMNATSATRGSSRDNRGIVILRVQSKQPRDTAGTCIPHGGVRVQEPPSGRQRSGGTHSIARCSRLLAHNVGTAEFTRAWLVIDRSLARGPPGLEGWEFGTR